MYKEGVHLFDIVISIIIHGVNPKEYSEKYTADASTSPNVTQFVYTKSVFKTFIAVSKRIKEFEYVKKNLNTHFYLFTFS